MAKFNTVQIEIDKRPKKYHLQHLSSVSVFRKASAHYNSPQQISTEGSPVDAAISRIPPIDVDNSRITLPVHIFE